MITLTHDADYGYTASVDGAPVARHRDARQVYAAAERWVERQRAGRGEDERALGLEEIAELMRREATR